MNILRTWIDKMRLWYFHRDEWTEQGKRYLGKRKLAFDRPNSPVVDLVEITWKHSCGYTMIRKYLS